jgi:hypothetical protein
MYFGIFIRLSKCLPCLVLEFQLLFKRCEISCCIGKTEIYFLMEQFLSSKYYQTYINPIDVLSTSRICPVYILYLL